MATEGVDSVIFAAIEAAFNTVQAVAASDAIAVTDVKITPSQEWHKSDERTGTASLQTEIKGKRGGKFEVSVTVKPTTAGTAPDCGPLIRGARFDETSSSYALRTDAPETLQLVEHVGDELYKVANGCCVEQMEIDDTGEIPMIKFSGSFASYGWLYGTPATDTAGYASGVSTLSLGAAHAFKIGVGACVAFGVGSDNGGDGYTITAVSDDGLDLTFTPTLQGGEDIAASAVTITPVTPTPTYTGTIQGAIENALTIDATAVGYTGWKCTIGTGVHLLDKERNSDRATRVAGGERTVQGECQFYFLDESASFAGATWEGTIRALVLRLGPNVANNRLTITLPTARLHVPEITPPADAETEYSMTFIARGTNNEIALVYA